MLMKRQFIFVAILIGERVKLRIYLYVVFLQYRQPCSSLDANLQSRVR